MFKYTKPSLVFSDPDNVETLAAALTELNRKIPILVFGNYKNYQNVEILFNETNLKNDKFKAPNIGHGMKQISMIICSSGTTDLPKGVSLTNSSILNSMFAS